MAEISLKQKRELAEILFCRSGLNRKETAEQVHVSQKTMGDWVEKFKWEDMRVSFARTRTSQLSMLNNLFNNQLEVIHLREDGKRVPTSAEYDGLNKLANSIAALERDTGIAVKIEVMKDFLEYVRAADLSKAQEIKDLSDGYVKSNFK